jgi:hypothetical protein
VPNKPFERGSRHRRGYGSLAVIGDEIRVREIHELLLPECLAPGRTNNAIYQRVVHVISTQCSRVSEKIHLQGRWLKRKNFAARIVGISGQINEDVYLIIENASSDVLRLQVGNLHETVAGTGDLLAYGVAVSRSQRVAVYLHAAAIVQAI